MNKRQTWKTLKESRPDTPERRAGYERAKRAHEIGAQVRQMREAAGITQAELARRMETKQPVIARLELGGVEPRFGMLDRVATALGYEVMIAFKPAPMTIHA